MLRLCSENDFEKIYEIINAAAMKYEGVIPDEVWRNPFMPEDYLQSELDLGVSFTGFERDGVLLGVMGVQDKGEVNLARHSYVLPKYQRQGIGSALLVNYIESSEKPVLVGCLKTMDWAITFYQKHGFELVSEQERDELRAKYWALSKAHVRNSVVLVDQAWRQLNPR